MKGPFRALLASFGTSALRQPVFTVLLFIPVIMGFFLRLVFTLLPKFVPVFDPEPWIPLILAVTAGFPPYLYGLLAALMLLDERDKELLPALRVTPVGDSRLLAAKIVPAVILTLIGVPLCLYLSGQSARIPPWGPPVMGLITAPLTAACALTVSALSTTKVQALTIGKILGASLVAPVGLVLLNTPWRYALLIIPVVPTSAVLSYAQGQIWIPIAFAYSTILAVMSWRYAQRRYFA